MASTIEGFAREVVRDAEVVLELAQQLLSEITTPSTGIDEPFATIRSIEEQMVALRDMITEVARGLESAT